MTFDSKFGTADVLRRLGITDPRHFEIGNQPLQGTIQLLDLSKSIAQEPVEARGYVNGLVNPLPGLFPLFAVFSRSPGGTIVERMNVETPGVAFITVTMKPFQHNVGVFTEQAALNIGGALVTTSVFLTYEDVSQDPSFGSNWEQISPSLLEDQRIFVAPGRQLLIQHSTAGGSLRASVIFREIEASK